MPLPMRSAQPPSNPQVPSVPGLETADRSHVVGALGRAGAGNRLLAISMGSGAGRSAVDLCARPGSGRAATTELVDAVARWTRHPERRVAASLVVLGYSARLVGATLAVLLREGILLDARPMELRYVYTPRLGFALRMPRPTGWLGPPEVLRELWCVSVIDEHVEPLIQAVREDTPVAAGLLWGNVASGITGALRALAEDRVVPLSQCHETGLALLDHASLRGTGELSIHNGELTFRRRSCCLYYRLDNGGLCRDCPRKPGARGRGAPASGGQRTRDLVR